MTHLFLDRDGSACAPSCRALGPKSVGAVMPGFDREAWERVDEEMMLELVFAKASQDPAVRAHLESAGGALIVEASPTDAVWGIGLKCDDPRALDPRQWRGQNKLGKAWTRAAQMLAAGASPPRSACSLAIDRLYEEAEPNGRHAAHGIKKRSFAPLDQACLCLTWVRRQELLGRALCALCAGHACFS
jgi:hypothetical protein